MSPARVEIEHPTTKEWVFMVEGQPGIPGGTFSDNKPDGSRELYKVDCSPDDYETVISKSVGGADINIGEGAREIFTEGFVPVVTLHHGETFEMTIKPDRAPRPVSIRVTHIDSHR